MPTFITIVLDGVGIGASEDAHAYGDAEANTLAHVCERARPRLPNLAAMGLGCIAPLRGVPCVAAPKASYGTMREVSAGKDSTTGHWELAGLRLDKPFPTYPGGFPKDVVDAFVEECSLPGVLGNKAASGTVIIDELGDRHVASGAPILYTSADSVFQVAAHVDVIPLDRLYEMCRVARTKICVGANAVGRVIARPFSGSSAAYSRISDARRDFALPPPGPPLQEVLVDAGITTASVGKVSDLFAGVGFSETYKTKSNKDGIDRLVELCRAHQSGFVWANLIDFDQEYGHRNDVEGFARALEYFDGRLPELLDLLGEGDALFVTADHGNDPTTPGTDHTREKVPVLLYDGRPGVDLGDRPTFNDHAATVLDFFRIGGSVDGSSMLRSHEDDCTDSTRSVP